MNIQIKDLAFMYTNEDTFQDISFDVSQGDIVTILGANGTGKTTLLKNILGFLKPTSGEILIDGISRDRIKDALFFQSVGYVPQAKLQSFPYSVEETVLMGRNPYISFFAQPSKLDKEKTQEAMFKAGISHLADKNTSEISGGELQLTFIARALAGQPKVLIMDEPETGLDYRNQLMILELIEKLSKEENISVIFTSHYPEHAVSISKKTLLMMKDKMSIFGDSTEVLNSKNMEDAFGVKIHISEEVIDGKKYSSLIPLAMTDKENK